SPDDSNSHKKFEQKFNLPFTMIADPKLTILNKYGEWGEKQMFGNKYMGVHRTTYLVDEKGVIRKIFLKPKVRQHAEEIIKAWKEIDNAGQKALLIIIKRPEVQSKPKA